MSGHERLHALDGLRAAMMLLGLVLHAAVSYVELPANHAWTFRDPQRAFALDLVVGFIHAFRMPTFMFLAGFFTALLVERRGLSGMLRNRARRILVPLLAAWPVLVPLTLAGFAFAIEVARTGSHADGLRAAGASNWFAPVTIHLWFLVYLVWLYAFAALVCAAPWPTAVRAWPRRIFRAALRARWTSALLAVPLVPLLAPTLGSLGVSFGLLPEPLSFACYGVVFACGWLLFAERAHLETLRSWRAVAGHLAASLVLFAIFGAVFHPAMTAILEGRSPDVRFAWLAAAAGALLVWHALWAFLGLSLLLLDRPLPAVRYVVDGSYWAYLVHLPFTIWLPGLLAPLPWPALVKFTVVLGVTTIACFVSYDLFVRATAIGTMLNGRRFPRGLART